MRKYATAFGLLAAVARAEPAPRRSQLRLVQRSWPCYEAGCAATVPDWPAVSGSGQLKPQDACLFRVDRGGILVAKVIYRDFDYEEYIRASLTCDGVNVRLLETEHLYGLSSPEWFRPLLGELWPAQRVTYSTAINRVCAYEFDLGFDLRSPPYSPFELTISVER